MPEYLSEHDREIFGKVRSRAFLLDSRFNFCGLTRFGLSSAIGFIPGVGDVIGVLMAVWILRTCGKIEGGLPMTLQSRMWSNIVLDFLVGLVPLLGDVAGTLFRSNKKNVALLEEYLEKKYAAARLQQQAEMAGIANVDGAYGAPRQYYPATELRMPERVRVPEVRKHGQAWFSGGNAREHQPDLEAGPVRIEQVRQDTRRSTP